MSTLSQNFSVPFKYDVHFTKSIFSTDNSLFASILSSDKKDSRKKILVVIDEGLIENHPDLFHNIQNYISHFACDVDLIQTPIVITGGETAKNDDGYVELILDQINHSKIDRHSYIMAIGGGAVIDAAGYASAIGHRGIRLIRIPTTVLAQNDASVGVKNGINAYGKKNFLGTFAPPFSVINDSDFLDSLDYRDWISGISEAIKVALLKDADFFDFIEDNSTKLAQKDKASMETLIYNCAKLHLDHISNSGDPFEMGSSRPLDFGHWSAHKLEQLTKHELRHGEAVAIGIALDVTYSYLVGHLSKHDWERVIKVFRMCGFRLYVPELHNYLNDPTNKNSLLHGLQEFREHLGGKLTIMLIQGIAKPLEVNEVNFSLYNKAVSLLEKMELSLKD